VVLIEFINQQITIKILIIFPLIYSGTLKATWAFLYYNKAVSLVILDIIVQIEMYRLVGVYFLSLH